MVVVARTDRPRHADRVRHHEEQLRRFDGSRRPIRKSS
jgi:hypothetical protein